MKHRSDFAVVTVFALFALGTLLVLLTGAGVYRSVAARGEQADAARTAERYLSTRVRQSGEAPTLEPFGDGDALILREGNGYLTKVYCYEGYLMELYCGENAALSPEDGEILFPLDALTLEKTEHTLFITLSLPTGEARSLIFHIP